MKDRETHGRPLAADATWRAAVLHRRGVLRAALGGTAALAIGVRAPAARGQAKPFSGVTINGAGFQHVSTQNIKDLLPEFEQATGMKVNFDLQAFPVYNQRMDLELSTGGSAYDFCNITFIYSGRWIGAGWLAPLDDFVADPKMTPAGWDAEDFVAGSQKAMQDAKGRTYGFAYLAGAMIMGAARGDILTATGLKPPETFDELIAVAQATHKKEGVAAFVADRLHHWNWIPYLMGFGGTVFRHPPDDLHPMLDTPEAAQAAEWYAQLLARYTPSGVLSFSDDQALRTQLAGRADMRTPNSSQVAALAVSPESKVKKTVLYAPMPRGPKGFFPGLNSHGFGIPKGSRNKEAAWAFITWAVSKDTVRRMALEKGYTAVCRRSVIDDPAYRKQMTLNGQDVASLYLQVLETAGSSDYMLYRTVPVFPQVGDKINKAIERIATGQADAATAMKEAQRQAIEDLAKAGVKL